VNWLLRRRAAAKAARRKAGRPTLETGRPHMRYKVYVSLTSADGTVEYEPPPVYFYDPSVNVLVSITSRQVGVVVVEELVAPTSEIIARRLILAIPDAVVEQLSGRGSNTSRMDGSDLAVRLERAESLAKDLDREGLYDETFMSTSEDGYLHVGRLEREVRGDGHLLVSRTDVRTFDPESPGASADAAEHFGEMVRSVDQRNAAKDVEREWQFGVCEADRLARVEAQHQRVAEGHELEHALREAAAQHRVHPASSFGQRHGDGWR
jgi:hypothetical protein